MRSRASLRTSSWIGLSLPRTSPDSRKTPRCFEVALYKRCFHTNSLECHLPRQDLHRVWDGLSIDIPFLEQSVPQFVIYLHYTIEHCSINTSVATKSHGRSWKGNARGCFSRWECCYGARSWVGTVNKLGRARYQPHRGISLLPPGICLVYLRCVVYHQAWLWHSSGGERVRNSSIPRGFWIFLWWQPCTSRTMAVGFQWSPSGYVIFFFPAIFLFGRC